MPGWAKAGQHARLRLAKLDRTGLGRAGLAAILDHFYSVTSLHPSRVMSSRVSKVTIIIADHFIVHGPDSNTFKRYIYSCFFGQKDAKLLCLRNPN